MSFYVDGRLVGRRPGVDFVANQKQPLRTWDGREAAWFVGVGLSKKAR